jgi:hypothetical protein
MLALLLVAALAESAQPTRPVSLATDLGLTGSPGAVGGVASVRVIVNLRPISLELGLGEGWLGVANAQTTRIFAGVRRYLWRGSYLRGGFAHAHEAGLDAMADDPMGTLMGTSMQMVHRTGAEVAAGWWLTVPGARLDGRLGVVLEVPCQGYAGGGKLRAYCGFAAGIGGHLGRPRRVDALVSADATAEEVDGG